MRWHEADNGNHLLFDDADELRGTVFPSKLAEGWSAVIDGQFLNGLWETPDEAQTAAERFAEDIDRGVAIARPAPVPAWQRAKKGGHFYKRTGQGVVSISTDKFGKGFYAYNDGRVFRGAQGIYCRSEEDAMAAVDSIAGAWIPAPWEV